MKPILIDDLISESHHQCEINRVLVGIKFYGWKIAKPQNYHFTFWEKLKLSYYILCGKAIAVQYFEDLSEKDKDEYIKKVIKNEK